MFILLDKKKAFVIFLLLGMFVAAIVGLFLSHGQQDEAVISWHLADQTIVIDPGHGGIFPGKVSKDGILEKDINLAIAKQLQALLAESGSITVLTRSSDEDLVPADQQEQKMILRQRADLTARTAIADASKADLFISLHCNSIPAEKWHGAQTFFSPQNDESAYLAQSIQAALIKQLKNTDREALIRKDTFLFEHLDIPAVIVECGFLSNTEEAVLLQDPLYQQKIAYAIFCGISDYLALTVKPQS